MIDFIRWFNLRMLERKGDLRVALNYSAKLNPSSRLYGNVIKLMRLKLALALNDNFERFDEFELIAGTKYDNYFESYRKYLQFTFKNDERAGKLAKVLIEDDIPVFVKNSLPVA